MTHVYAITEEQIENILDEMEAGSSSPADMGKVFKSLPKLDQPEGEPVPPFGSKRNAALALYKAPFSFEHGYIFDADRHMVADDNDVESHVAARVRGWGRIGYMPEAAKLQDEVGAIIAEALTDFWNKSKE